MRDHKPRAQKRQEYKQVVGLLVLVLAVASVSFALGVAVGKRRAAELVSQVEAEQQQAKSVVQNSGQADASPEDAPKVNLTFYDTLPKGEETPLGSGINPPPEEKSATPAAAFSDTPEKVNATASESKSPISGATSTTAKAKVPAVTSGEYVVQVASFQSEEDARNLQNRMLAKGHRALLQRVDLKEKGVWTRVYIGFFSSKESAQKVVDRLAAEDRLTPMIRRRE